MWVAVLEFRGQQKDIGSGFTGPHLPSYGQTEPAQVCISQNSPQNPFLGAPDRYKWDKPVSGCSLGAAPSGPLTVVVWTGLGALDYLPVCVLFLLGFSTEQDTNGTGSVFSSYGSPGTWPVIRACKLSVCMLLWVHIYHT